METVVYNPSNWLDPLDWSQVFPEPTRPLEIDVGCGKGGFLLWAAGVHPSTNHLGIERQLVRLRKVDKKVQTRQLANVRLLRIEAGYFVGKLIPLQSVNAYYIFFPDPWPKRRHQANRLFQPEFVADLVRTLKPGGAVNVATDDLDYFAQIQKVMHASGRFCENQADMLPVEAQTEFEKVFIARGRPIGRAKFLVES
ncbi:MAG: tRNA (guanosine(46)-N7)-methyltransferase TrmB [Verrucomicrobiota bacterium]|jgi:tRNA (guanine-N7-)-methyltransferase